jgi:hypothetical protein
MMASGAGGRDQRGELLPKELNGHLVQPLTSELKRELVEALVEGIRVDTIEENGKKEAILHVAYRFDPRMPGLRLARTPVRFTIRRRGL